MYVNPRNLLVVAVIAALLALTAPLYTLLVLDLLLVPLREQTEVGGVILDQTDVIFGILLLGFVLRRPLSLREFRRRVPFFRLWLALGILMSIVYLTAPINQPHLTAFHRAVYQVYRGAWKPILYFPLSAVLLGFGSRSRFAVFVLVLAGDICALMALPEGLQGLKADGPFGTGNSLGAALIVPFVASFGYLLAKPSQRARWFYGASFLLCGRALLYAGSRGAIAGVISGIGVILWFLALRSTGRNRLLQLVPAGLASLLLLFALKPDLMERPNVKRALTLTDPMEEDTLNWRINERWDHYWQRSLQRPWLGHGTDTDPVLRDRGGAKTPHSVYLSLTVKFGFPASVLFLLLSGLCIYRGLRHFSSLPFGHESMHSLILAAGMIGIMGHGLVDSVLNINHVTKTFWVLGGLAAALPLVVQRAEAAFQARQLQETGAAKTSLDSVGQKSPEESGSPFGLSA